MAARYRDGAPRRRELKANQTYMISDISNREPWAVWKRANAKKLLHPADYEEKFVDLVLSRVPGLKPDDVIPQFAFKDNGGGNRRIDFVILNEDKGYLLPIEVDGRSKDDVSSQWTDFLDRQNALIGSFGTVLRYSNAKMFNNSNAIIREISDHLANQAAAKVAWGANKAILDNFMALAGATSSPAKLAKNRSHWKPVGITAFFVLVAAGVVALSMRQGVFSLPASPSMRERITPSQAAAYIGERKRVCGLVSGVSEVPAGIFINFERRYPNQTLTAVIWRKDFAAVGKVDVSNNETICIEGTIEQYDRKPRIQLSSRDQFAR